MRFVLSIKNNYFMNDCIWFRVSTVFDSGVVSGAASDADVVSGAAADADVFSAVFDAGCMSSTVMLAFYIAWTVILS